VDGFGGSLRAAGVLALVIGASACGRVDLDPISGAASGIGGGSSAAAGAGGRVPVSGMGGASSSGGSGMGGAVGTGGRRSGVGGATVAPGTGGATVAPGTGGAGAGGSGPSISANYAINAAHDGTQLDEAVRTPLAPRWSVNIHGEVFYPLIAGGRLFLSYADGQPKLAAYDLQSGAPVWGPITLSTTVQLTYDVGNVFGLDQNGIVTAWDGATGLQVWTAKAPSQYSFDAYPVAIGGLVYVNGLGSGGTIFAFDGLTGRLRWSTNYYGGEGAVTIGDGTLYEVSGCQQVSAMDAFTGQNLRVIHSTSCTGGGGGMAVYNDGRLWIIDNVLGDVIIDRNGTVVRPYAGSPPAVHAGTAFHVANGVTAVDVATGATTWSTAISGVCTSPIVAGRGRQLFVATTAGTLFELDEVTGAVVSQHDPGFLPYASCWPMALAEGRLAFAMGTGVAVY
jgi:hypothetical protein